jgi:hypothetical protein
MTSNYNDMTDMSLITKNVYGKGVVDLVPQNEKPFFDELEFAPASETIGLQFVEAVNVGLGSGIVTGTASGGPLTFGNPTPGAVVNAIVDGYQIANRQWLDYALASKARKQGQQAFEDVIVRVVNNLLKQHRRRQLSNLLYGGSAPSGTNTAAGGLGIVASSTSSSTTITITQASWAPALWWFSDNTQYEVWNSTFTTARNSTTPLTLSSYSMANRTLTFSGATSSMSCSVGDVIIPYGGSGSLVTSGALTDSLGLEAILDTSFTPGTLFSINQSTFPVFQPNSFNVGSTSMTLALLDAAANQIYQKGHTGDMVLFCAPGTFSDLAAEEVTRVHLTQGLVEGKATVGFNALELTLQAGKCRVYGSPWIKCGEAFLFAEGIFRRIGSVDILHGDPRDLDTVWFNIPNVTAYETRSYSLQAAFTSEPAYSVVLYGIVNNHN